MRNETGSYPGQVWLAPVSFFYQIPPWNTSASADLLILITVTVLGLLLAFWFVRFLYQRKIFLRV